MKQEAKQQLSEQHPSSRFIVFLRAPFAAEGKLVQKGPALMPQPQHAGTLPRWCLEGRSAGAERG